MEAQNFLAHHVEVRGPVFVVIVIRLIVIAQRRDIVRKRVHPHIHGVAWVEVDGDAPLHRSADTQVSCRPWLMKAIISFLRLSGWMKSGTSSYSFRRRSAYLLVLKK